MTNPLPQIFTIAIALTGLAHAAGAQQSPPVLSTTPESPPGSVPVPAQMSGLPLQVADLPPGIVVVRVIRQTFSENIEGQPVTLHDPLGERILESVTDAEGRAQFTALPVGSAVQARTMVDGESLTSQIFPLPTRGGVRLVLVAGIGAVTPETFVSPPSISRQSPMTPLAGTRENTGGRLDGSITVSALLACTTVITGFVFVRRRRSHRVAVDDEAAALEQRGAGGSPDAEAAPSGPTTSIRRATAFEELVRLEKDHRAGRIPAPDYAGRREALMAEIIQIG